MDKLGQVFRDLARAARDSEVRSAASLAEMLRKDGLTNAQVEEMLFANGFESDVVSGAMEMLPKRPSRGRTA
jgi:hypothetical protein